MEIEEEGLTAARNAVHSIKQQMLLLQRQLEVFLQRYPVLSQDQPSAAPRDQALQAKKRIAPQATPKKPKPALQAITRDAQKALPAPSPTPAICSPPVPALPDSPDSPDPSLPEDVEFSSPLSPPDEEFRSPELSSASESSDSDDFTVVNGKRKRSSKKDHSRAPPAKTPIRRVASVAQSAHPSASTTAAAKERPPPPIYLRQKEKWDHVSALCRNKGVNFTHAKSTRDGIKIQVSSSSDHRRLTSSLREEGIGYHTFALEDERLLRVVIRGLPAEHSTTSIKEDLLSQNFPVREVHRMVSARTKKTYELVLVVLDRSPEGKRIFDLKVVNDLSGLSVEPPHRSGNPAQCHRCQLYGHSARNCFARPRCVKCLGDHGTADCNRTPESTDPPACVLCGTTGHTANYRGCPRAPPANKRVARRAPERISRPSAPQYTKSTPKVDTVPAPPPTRNAWDKPLHLGRQAPPSPPIISSPYRPPPLRQQAKRPTAPPGPKPTPRSHPGPGPRNPSTDELIEFGEHLRAIKMFIANNKALFSAVMSPNSPFD